MWLQLRLYLLIGLLFAILYAILTGIGYLLGGTGNYFYVFMIALAVGIVLLQYMIGPKTVEWSMKIQYVKKEQHPKLHQMIEELAEQADLPKKPRVGISKIDIPNAFAFGRTQKDARVCVTQGILDLLSEKELKAVLGHEISHVKHRDMAVITMLSVVPMICYMIYISFFWGGIFGGRQRNAGAMLAIGLLALVVYFVTNLLVMYGSRIREYYADLGSAELGTQPHQLATALYKLSKESAKISKKKLKQAEGMKAFLLNDPSQARNEVNQLKDIDVDMNGTIDQNELMMLQDKEVKLSKSDKIMEIMSTHPNMVKRVKHLSQLT